MLNNQRIKPPFSTLDLLTRGIPYFLPDRPNPRKSTTNQDTPESRWATMMQHIFRYGLPSRGPFRVIRSPQFRPLRWGSRTIGHYEAHGSMTPRNATLPHHDFGIHLCNKISTLLKESGVENILWGSHLMATYTVPVLIQVMFSPTHEVNISGLYLRLPLTCSAQYTPSTS